MDCADHSFCSYCYPHCPWRDELYGHLITPSTLIEIPSFQLLGISINVLFCYKKQTRQLDKSEAAGNQRCKVRNKFLIFQIYKQLFFP